MKSLNTLIATTLMIAAFSATANDSGQNLSEGSKHSVLAAGHSAVGGSQVASGAVAVPMLMVGGVGQLSKTVGNEMVGFASGQPQPLPVSDKTITADAAPNMTMLEE
ncbi:hypothetical protein GCM10011369_00390 [Neiella marina]|uniref:Uncharacterized protein n=1 Tax=Neiella marina TaxID=508461 RepID=A0A8J2XKM9_9GAMM|nr:hypothetical protein [Neiella marina]GGA63025.1 hypothetical protein GCM10011369_00390 [Neiella marina]